MKVDIRTKTSEGVAPLYTRTRIGGKSQWIHLYLEVDIAKWNEVKDSDIKRKNYLDKKGYTIHLNDIEFGIREL